MLTYTPLKGHLIKKKVFLRMSSPALVQRGDFERRPSISRDFEFIHEILERKKT
jgi:hypothetical protein